MKGKEWSELNGLKHFPGISLEIKERVWYYYTMRQRFDIGDLVQIEHPTGSRGIVLETRLLNAHMTNPEHWIWHPDEYSCKVKCLRTKDTRWVRAKWLRHLSKISE